MLKITRIVPFHFFGSWLTKYFSKYKYFYLLLSCWYMLVLNIWTWTNWYLPKKKYNNYIHKRTLDKSISVLDTNYRNNKSYWTWHEDLFGCSGLVWSTILKVIYLGLCFTHDLDVDFLNSNLLKNKFEWKLSFTKSSEFTRWQLLVLRHHRKESQFS